MTTFADYNEFIQRELKPQIVDTVIYDAIEPFFRYFTRDNVLGGDRITAKFRVGHTSNNAQYDKSDVDVAAATQTLVKPYWSKKQYTGTAEVHGIDISNDAPNPQGYNLIGDAVEKEAAAMKDTIQAALLAQLLADVDSSGTAYSDASLSRSTYATLASYEEATDATITLAYMRTMMQTVTLNKPVALSDYICLCEGSTYYTFKALAAALHTWNTATTPGSAQPMGWSDFDNFEGLAFALPSDFTNMLTGSIFMLRRQDVFMTEHRPLEMHVKESNRDSSKVVMYYGVNTRRNIIWLPQQQQHLDPARELFPASELKLFLN
jgi:hypothetical protein